MRPTLAFLIRDLGYGGAQRQLATLACGLAARGDFDVHVVCFYGGPLRCELENAGIPVHCIEKGHRWDLAGFFLRLVGTLRSIRPDLVHSYLAEANLMASLTRPFCRRPTIVWGIRDSQSDAHQWGILGKLAFRLNVKLSSTARGLISNSHAGRQWYREQGYPMDDEDFRVIPNGIDVSRFTPSALAQSIRREWGFDDRHSVVGIIGRLNPMKDHPTFLQAAARVAADSPHVRFVVMGHGPETYLAELTGLAEKLGLSDKLRWLPPQQDLENLYPALTTLVSSSSFGEGFSNVIGEAMACGIPCVATAVGDSALLIGDTGWTCPPGDPDTLAAGILHLLQLSGDKRSELSQSARKRIEDNFTTDLMVQRTASALIDWLPLK